MAFNACMMAHDACRGVTRLLLACCSARLRCLATVLRYTCTVVSCANHKTDPLLLTRCGRRKLEGHTIAACTTRFSYLNG
jgi:hypothetical protein